MGFPTHAQWMKDTSLNLLKPRSSALKAVDEALLQYEKIRNQQNLWRLKNALEDWKRSKGAGWATSDRNRTRIISNLDHELGKVADYRTYQITHFSMQELMALSHVAKERKKVLVTLFKDKEVTFKASKIKDQLRAAQQDVKETSEKAVAYLQSIRKPGPKPPSAGPSAGDIVKAKLIDMTKSFFGVAGIEQIGQLSGLIIELIQKCAVSVPPVVGHIKDGYDLFTGWAKVGAKLHTQFAIAERNYSIDTGAPAAAFDALVECLKDETKNEAASAATATSSFALKTGLAFLDGGAISGPVVGAAAALAEFSRQLYLLASEWRATKAVNVALDNGNLDIGLFRTYPLMGCYLLVSATLSDLIPIESFGTPGWMDYIENMKKNAFDDIYKSAFGLIDDSPWEMIGLPKRPKGTTGGILAHVQKVFSTVSPLSDLKDLKGLATGG